MKLAVSLLVATAVVPVGRLYAHDFWIEPTDFRPATGEQVSLLLRVGQDLSGDRLPYINDWFSDYRVVGPDGPRPVTGRMGDDPAGHFATSTAGIHVIGYRSTRDFVELDAEKFRSYLVDEGLEKTIELRAARGDSGVPAREYYSRCAKSIVQVGADGPPDAYAVELGYTLELIPERNPYELTAGDSLPLRAVYRGKAIEGLLVQGFTASTPEQKVAVRTDALGRAELPLGRAGLWLVKAVHMIETPADDVGAEWESFWASLTFRLADP